MWERIERLRKILAGNGRRLDSIESRIGNVERQVQERKTAGPVKTERPRIRFELLEGGDQDRKGE